MGTKKGAGQTAPTMEKPKPTEQAKNASIQADTLMPIVTKLTDVRIVNNEIKGMLSSARVEYYMMAGMVVGNIPLLYFLNKDWFNALMFTTLGKLVLAICGLVIIVTAVLMLRFTKQIEYRK